MKLIICYLNFLKFDIDIDPKIKINLLARNLYINN
jgi:hypothetical protein